MEVMELIERASHKQILNMSGPDGYDFVNYDDTFPYKGEDYMKMETLYYRKLI